ncbi:MAG: response regulator [Flavobacteriales bacterium]
MDEIDLILIEDNDDDAELTIDAIRNDHQYIKFVHLRDGEEALDYVRAMKPQLEKSPTRLPRLFLIDIKMPKVSGLDVLRELKSDLFFQKVPVVIFTSSSELDDITQAYSLGANSYVVKPLEFQLFMSTISRMAAYWFKVNQTRAII